jgi:hypothetical protein
MGMQHKGHFAKGRRRLIQCLNALVLILTVLWVVNGSFSSDQASVLATFRDSHDVCRQTCPFLGRQMNITPAVEMTSFKGFGRTGNYIRAMKRAVNLAFVCKLQIKLPKRDDESGALPINEMFMYLDFSKRNGPVPNVCADLNLPLLGDAAFFWNFRMQLLEDDKFKSLPPGAYRHLTETCIQKYLGICDPGFCAETGFGHRTDSILVAHVREGDIFQNEGTSVDAPCYGQPPLSYYVQAMTHQPWSRVVVVGEPGNFGPLRSALASISTNKSFLGEMDLVFQSKTWSEDLRTLMCASNLLTARTSLIPLFNMGFAKRIYSYSCLTYSTDKEYYIIGVENYPYWKFHDGGQKERADLLVHGSSVPKRCYSNSVTPEEPNTCLSLWTDTSVL